MGMFFFICHFLRRGVTPLITLLTFSLFHFLGILFFDLGFFFFSFYFFFPPIDMFMIVVFMERSFSSSSSSAAVMANHGSLYHR